MFFTRPNSLHRGKRTEDSPVRSAPDRARDTLSATLLTAAMTFLPGLQAGAQEFLPVDPPPTGRILRWVDANPAGAVDLWEWRHAQVPDSPWSPIHGATLLESSGVWYGIAFPPPGFFVIEIRALALTEGAGVIASAPSNPIQIPGCFDADINRDGAVGGPDFSSLGFHWAQICVASN